MDAFAPIREFADFTNNRQPDYPGFYSQQQERPYGRKGGNQLQQLAANSNARGGQQMLQKRRFNRRTRPTTEFPVSAEITGQPVRSIVNLSNYAKF